MGSCSSCVVARGALLWTWCRAVPLLWNVITEDDLRRLKKQKASTANRRVLPQMSPMREAGVARRPFIS